jgi:hypothetical protein
MAPELNYSQPCYEHAFDAYDSLGHSARRALQNAVFNWCAECARQTAKAEGRPIKEVVADWDRELT